MRSRRLVFAALVAVALVTVSCGGSGSSDTDTAADSSAGEGDGGGATTAGDDPAPEAGSAADGPLTFTATAVDGSAFDASSRAGTDVVLWFWAPWCTTCRGEAPDIVAAAEAYEGEVEFIGVASLGDVPDMEDFVSDTGTDGFVHLADEDGAIWTEFGVVRQPAFAFIDDDGTVEVHAGALGADGLEERLSALTAA